MSEDRLDQLDYYTLLGVADDASADQIKAAFHQFARKYHPDRFAAAPPDKRARAAQIYRRGTEGYRVLTDAAKRRRYDQGLEQGRLRFDPTREGGAAADRTRARVLPPRARPFAAKARQAIRTGDWQTARLNLKLALSHAPGHAELEGQLAEVVAKLGSK